MSALELLSLQRDQYQRELSNLEAQKKGVEKAMEIMTAKRDAMQGALDDLRDMLDSVGPI